MCLNNKKQLEIAKILLENNYKLIMIIPYGILQFKYSDNLRKYQDKYTVLSFLSPMQEVRRYEYVNSLKKCLTLADIVLCCCENTEDIEKIVKYLKGYNNLFYIYYGEKSVEAFVGLNAKKISISSITKKPNVAAVKQILDMEK